MLGKIESTISARLDGEPGSGSVTIYNFDEQKFVPSVTVDAFNVLPVEIEAGKWCSVRHVGCDWWIENVEGVE